MIRRVAVCYIESGDFNSAKDVLAELPENAQSAALTQYLQFKINLRFEADEVITQTIEKLVACKDFQLTMLYHCALEAQSLQKQEVSLALLSIIISRSAKSDTNLIRLPALLRCTIRMLRDFIDANVKYIDLLCTHFEMAAQCTTTEEKTIKNGFNLRELEWFSKTGHNVAVQGLTSWPATSVLRITNACKSVTLRAETNDS